MRGVSKSHCKKSMWMEDGFVVIFRNYYLPQAVFIKVEDAFALWLTISLLDIYPREIVSHVNQETQHFVITKKLKAIKCPATLEWIKIKIYSLLVNNELRPHTLIWMNHKNNVELKKRSVEFIYYLYQGLKKQSDLCYFMLFRNIYICGKLVNYREKQRND